MRARQILFAAVSLAAITASTLANAQAAPAQPQASPGDAGTPVAPTAADPVGTVAGQDGAQVGRAAPLSTAPVPTDEAPLQEDTPVGDIVVTGSRIARAGFAAPTPVQVVNTEDLIKRQPSTLADALYQLPAFQNSINAAQFQPTQANRQRTGNYLNLRALGTQRVLVLQDGQRLPQTGTNGGVDASLVPQLLTQRIDVVTGGASATYGSEAVSGVVNFIIDKRFEGVKSQLQRGISSRGFGGSYRAGIAGGLALAEDRLHLIASAERYHTDVVLRSQIPSIGRAISYLGAGTAASPFTYQDNLRQSNTSFGGLILSGPLAGQQFAAGGVAVPFDRGQATNTPGLQIGGDGGYFGQQCCTITPGQTQNQLFARAEYEFDADTSVFVSSGFNFSENGDFFGQLIAPVTTIYRENAFLASSTVAALGSTASFTLGKTDPAVAPLFTRQQSDSTLINAGVKGRITDGLRWQAGYTYGRTFFETTLDELNNPRYFAAIDAVRDPAGSIVCRVSLINPALYPGCVPVDLFGAGSISAAGKAYIFTQSQYSAVNTLNSAQASVSGTAFGGWAGPISFAVGGEVRRQTLRQISNSDPAVPVDFTGLRGVPAGTLRFRALNQGVANGAYTIKEVFGELDVPLLKSSAVGSLSVNGAARLTDYTTSGSVTTWKVGALYDPLPGVRARATLSRDIRAPTLFELFAGRTSQQARVTDNLTRQEAIVQVVSGGNPALTPEIARTFTAGLVFGPELIEGLSLSLDYYDISIKDAIAAPFSALQIVDLCAASNYTGSTCAFITRPLGPTDSSPANAPTAISVFNQNLSTAATSGIDAELRYNFRAGPGRITLDAAATRLISYTQTNAPGSAELEFAGTADFNDGAQPVPLPKWRGTFGITAELKPVTFFIQERIIGGFDRSRLLVYSPNKVGTVGYTDASLIFDVPAGRGNFQLFTTVNNLFGRKAPILPTNRAPGQTAPTIRTTYDIVGTYITVGVRTRL